MPNTLGILQSCVSESQSFAAGGFPAQQRLFLTPVRVDRKATCLCQLSQTFLFPLLSFFSKEIHIFKDLTF